MRIVKTVVSAFLCFTLLVSLGLCLSGCATGERREEIVISIPYNKYIRNIDTNYYKEWLEQQTGLSIKFNIVHDVLTADYLRAMFASGYVKSDAFFSIFDNGDLSENNIILQEFGEKGYIIPLNDYIKRSTRLNAIFEDYDGYDLRSAITSPDGNIYYVPGLDPSESESNFTVLWLNESWLKRLKLNIPRTTADFRDVLYAFKNNDPNGNGEYDEIPLAGSNNIPSEQSYNFIINAFICNDPDNTRIYIKDGIAGFAPVTPEWREAMQYLRALYDDGLLDPLQFALGHNGLETLANDPARILGGFTGASVTDVIYRDNPELIHNYVHIAPLTGPDGTCSATARTPLPTPAGVITSECKNPEAVFRLFDLMLSEEAFLIGRYGEENTDWIPAYSTDLDSYGNKATVRVINQLWDVVQNKHICETGPFFAYPKYVDGVTFLGSEAAQEYVNARAYRAYGQYKPDEYIKTVLFYQESLMEQRGVRASVDVYVNENIKKFITGETNPYEDVDWDEYVCGFAGLGIDELLKAVQVAYDKTVIQGSIS